MNTRLVLLCTQLLDDSPERLAVLGTLGGSLYRHGNPTGAERTLRNVIQGRETEIEGSLFFFLAMACHQLGRDEEGQDWFQKGVAQSDSETAWDRRVINRILRAEAESLLKPSETPRPAIGEELEAPSSTTSDAHAPVADDDSAP
jgi:hypothetical protein